MRDEFFGAVNQCVTQGTPQWVHICVRRGWCDFLTFESNGISEVIPQGRLEESSGNGFTPTPSNSFQILFEILTFHFKKTHLKMLCAKWQQSCSGYNVWWRCINAMYIKRNMGQCNKSLQLRMTDTVNWKVGNIQKYPRLQGSCGQHGAHLGPVSPSWAPWALLSGISCMIKIHWW